MVKGSGRVHGLGISDREEILVSADWIHSCTVRTRPSSPPLWMMRKGGGFCERFDDQVGSHRFFLLFGDPRSLMGNAQAAAPFSSAEMPESLLNSPARNNRAPARESQVQSRHLLRRS